MPDHYRDRKALKEIAKSTIKAIDSEEVEVRACGRVNVYALHTQSAIQNTQFFQPNDLYNWHSSSTTQVGNNNAYISIIEISTLGCSRLLTNILRNTKTTGCGIGVLNFASAIKPGGGFMNGAQAQEESIARSSTLYPTLGTHAAQEFYRLYKDDPNNFFYTDGMIYSPRVEAFRDDDGAWMKPIFINVLTCAAVNAREVRKSRKGHPGGRAMEDQIKSAMKERMARILYLFEWLGIRNIVLGSFGTGVFGNDVDVVAHIWADLLSVPNARFGRSFDRVMFAITGRRTFDEFEESFNGRGRRPPFSSGLL
jgi:uncharacterized protein (TIGR02452 family)